MSKIVFWINSFIPKTVEGYTVIISKGVHMNKTAIPLPVLARLFPTLQNTFKPVNTGYLTDQRGFNDVYGASARMTSVANFDLNTLKFTQEHLTSGTTEVNLSSGLQTGFAPADMKRCSFVEVNPTVAALVGLRDRDPGNVIRTWRLVAAARDPLVVGSADIDYRGHLTIRGNLTRGVFEVSFKGLVDAFPAYDCYASYNNTTKTLFQLAPPPGNTVLNLLGPPNREISGWVTFRPLKANIFRTGLRYGRYV